MRLIGKPLVHVDAKPGANLPGRRKAPMPFCAVVAVKDHTITSNWGGRGEGGVNCKVERCRTRSSTEEVTMDTDLRWEKCKSCWEEWL